MRVSEHILIRYSPSLAQSGEDFPFRQKNIMSCVPLILRNAIMDKTRENVPEEILQQKLLKAAGIPVEGHDWNTDGLSSEKAQIAVPIVASEYGLNTNILGADNLGDSLLGGGYVMVFYLSTELAGHAALVKELDYRGMDLPRAVTLYYDESGFMTGMSLNSLQEQTQFIITYEKE